MGAFARAMDRLAEWVRWLAEAVRLLKPRQSPQNAQGVLEAFLSDVPVDERTEDELRAEGVPVDDIKDTEEREYGLGSETVGVPAEGAETVVGEEGAGPEGDVRADSEPVGADVEGDIGSGDVGRGAEPAQGVKHEETREERLERRARQRREANENRERLNRLMKKNRKYGGRRHSIENLFSGAPVMYLSPSTSFIGSNETTAAYGWGLYASNKLGIAIGYSLIKNRAINSRLEYVLNGKKMSHVDAKKYLDDTTGLIPNPTFNNEEEGILFFLIDEIDHFTITHSVDKLKESTILKMVKTAIKNNKIKDIHHYYNLKSLEGIRQLPVKEMKMYFDSKNNTWTDFPLGLGYSVREEIRKVYAGTDNFMFYDKEEIDSAYERLKDLTEPTDEEAKAFYDKHVTLNPRQPGFVMQQTWWTNRAPGDTSHLLLWELPLSDANRERVVKAVESLGIDEGRLADVIGYKDWRTQKMTGGEAYRMVEWVFEKIVKPDGGIPENERTDKATSQLLYKFDIDGNIHHVGDPKRQNFVAFSDEHLRVDHAFSVDNNRNLTQKFSTEKPGDEGLSATVRSVREALRRDGDKAVELLGGTILSNYVREETDAALRKRVARAAVERLFNVVPVSEERLRQAGLIEETLALPEDEDEVASEYEDAKIVDARNRLAHGGVLVGESQAEAVVRARAKQVLGKTFRYLFEVYHGTPHAGWTRWERGHGGTTGLGYAYFAPRVITAAEYADTSDTPNKGLADVKDMQRYGLSEAVYHMVVGMNNPLIVDCRRASWNNIRMKNKRTVRTDEILNVARFGELGYDGVIFLNVHDSQLSVKLHGYDVDVVPLGPVMKSGKNGDVAKQMKSLDGVTVSDVDVPEFFGAIDIRDRFDVRDPDIRWSTEKPGDTARPSFSATAEGRRVVAGILDNLMRFQEDLVFSNPAVEQQRADYGNAAVGKWNRRTREANDKKPGRGERGRAREVYLYLVLSERASLGLKTPVY